jgi:hypothetical protein
MAKQSNLENIAIQERTEELIHSSFDYNEENQYNASHKDALADGDKKGKGTGDSLSALSIPGTKGTHATSTKMGIAVNTDTSAGNLYDTDGTKGVQGAFQGDAGRKYLMSGSLNLYTPNNEYGVNSIDTSANVAAGQYTVK